MPELGDFIQLGEAFFHVQNPQAAHADSYSNDVGRFLDLLHVCGMNRTFTAATPLQGATIVYNMRSKVIAPGTVVQLQTLCRSISHTLYEEAKSKGIAFVDHNAVPTSISNLPSALGLSALEPHQEALRQDVMHCMRIGAYRPAIVVAWALTFDLVRFWVFSDSARLQEFNAWLQRRTQQIGVRQIVDFDDFFEEKESFVLDICRDAQNSLADFTAKTHRLLQRLLDDRNAFAHANYNNATESEARAYIDRCIRQITSSPFV